jgi:chloride channel protein, CIC family
MTSCPKSRSPEAGSGPRGSFYLVNLLWAAILGLVSGLACVAVRLLYRLLQWLLTGHGGLLSDAAAHMPLWRRAITPAIGALLAMAVIWVSRRFAGKFEEYVEAVRLDNGRISFLPTLWRTISSAFSVATGAAIGREGSMIQFAAAATSVLGRSLRISSLPLATQVACGAAAAVATAYQAPVAGMFFAAEIVVGRLSMAEAPLLLVSALVGSITGRYILGGGPLFAVAGRPVADLHHAVMILPLAALMSVSMGVLGPAYYLLIRSLRSAAKLPLALVWSGVVVGVLSLHSTEIWGNGDAALLSIMHASPAMWTLLSVLVLRLCATTFCVGTGTVGGVFTPTLFAGAALGLLAVRLIHAPDPLLFATVGAIVGMACLLAAVTHAPLMAALMAVELTGQWMLLPLILLCTVASWAVARSISHHSLYALATPEPVGGLADGDLPATPVHVGVFHQNSAHRKEAHPMEVVEAGE